MDRAPAHNPELRIGCAGWSIPAAAASHFPGEGSHLQRYARVFNAVEINSSFYRPHRPATYARWADSVPASFRFSVKMPRAISHTARLHDCSALLEAFLAQVNVLGDRLGCLLLQLPPSLAWEPDTARRFLDQLRQRHAGPVGCEPRHRSWFSLAANRMLREFRVMRVAADPALCPRAAWPAGDRDGAYLRLHGSPRMYYDAYPAQTLERIAMRLKRQVGRGSHWCIFDNTARGHATTDALALQRWLGEPGGHGHAHAMQGRC